MRAEECARESQSSTEVFIGDLITRYLELPDDPSAGPQRDALLVEFNCLTAQNPAIIDRLLEAQTTSLNRTEAALGAYQAQSGDLYQQ